MPKRQRDPDAVGPAVELTYTNYRGETDTRRVSPIRIWYGATDWHPESQWLLQCYDCDRKAMRDYALKDCDFTYAGSNSDG